MTPRSYWEYLQRAVAAIAIAGAVLISALNASFLHRHPRQSRDRRRGLGKRAGQTRGGIPFHSDADLRKALEDAGVPAATTDEIVAENEQSRLARLRALLAVLAHPFAGEDGNLALHHRRVRE